MLASAAAATAQPAATVLAPCGHDLTCGRVTVALDPTGAVPGTLSLYVARYDSSGASSGTILALAGGPGQSAVAALPVFVATLAPLLHDRALVVFDPRGVGRSSPVRCPPTDTAGDCAQELGPAAALYSTVNSVDDIEAVRAALGIPQLSLYGVSYGTFTALAYAREYPTHVQRLVLDSVLPADGDPPLSESTLAAIHRVFGAHCELQCPGPSPLGELARAIGRPPYGSRAQTIGALALATLEQSDLSPLLRAEIPTALYLLAHGDGSALQHVYSLASGVFEGTQAGLPGQAGQPAASAVLRAAGRPAAEAVASAPAPVDAIPVATECDDDRFPWQTSEGTQARIAAAQRALAALPAALVAPFPGQTVLSASNFQLCLTWPYAGDDPPRVAAPLPAVPTLLLAGEEDLRTPLADARALAAQLPDAILLAVPDTGHAVLASEGGRCASKALVAFFAGATVARCPRAGAQPLDPLPPRSVSALAPAPPLRGRPGRVLRALELTLRHDVGLGIQYVDVGGSGSGTLGGSIRVVHRGRYYINLRDVSYVRGVALTGVLYSSSAPAYPGRVVVTVAGHAYGTVTLHGDGLITGSLGGRAFRLTLSERRLILREGGLADLPSY